MSGLRPRRVVYTALFGGYETLTEQPVALGSDVDFICFTDDPGLRSTTWDVRIIEAPLPGDIVRSCRILKIRGHELLDDYDESLWIDNSVLLRRDPARLLDEWLDGADLAVPWHSYRRNVVAEFDAVASAGRDDPSRIYEQLSVYSEHAPEVLEAEVLWTAILARRRSTPVRSAMTVWLDQVLRFSRRDQLSVRYSLNRADVEPRVVEIDNWASEWHEWPVTSGRPKGQEFQFEFESALNAPSIAELARLHSDIDELTAQYSEAVSLREIQLSEMLSSRTWRLRTWARDRLRDIRDAVRNVRRAA